MNSVYQLKIELKGSNPSIWRRIKVYKDISFAELHDTIQIVMGWECEHPYKFIYKNINIYDFEHITDFGKKPSEMDSMSTFMDEAVAKVKTKFTYLYDFGDHWEHTILIEKILPNEEGKTFPICLDGVGACPPEDTGGIWAYQEMLRILKDKSDPEYAGTIDLLGKKWNPEFFNWNQVNDSLQRYIEQKEKILEDIDKQNEYSEEDLWDDPFIPLDNAIDTDQWMNFTKPEDVLRDKYQSSILNNWLETSLDDTENITCQTLERLRDLGFNEKKSKNLILEAVSIEWFYNLKYDIAHLPDRYNYNLEHLPQSPQEFTRSKDALDVLDLCLQGIPFAAIEYLRNDTSAETTAAILKALNNHSDHQYCWGQCMHAPLWYAFAAEGHLCEELIDLVIKLFKKNPNESDWLYDQGQYLIGALAQKYPDLTTTKVLDFIDQEIKEVTMDYIFYLFDAFHFCDLDKYKDRLLSLLKDDYHYWYDIMAKTFADIGFKEALPLLHEKLDFMKAEVDKDAWQYNNVLKVAQAIDILEGKITPQKNLIKPLCLMREGSWQEIMKEEEDYFFDDDYDAYDDDDEGFLNPIEMIDQTENTYKRSNPWLDLTPAEPFIKEKTPERNDPCPCGSGKKYKKCCMDK